MFGKKSKKIKELESEIARLNTITRRSALEAENERYKAAKYLKNAEIIAAERDKLKHKVKEQIEDDLLKTSLKIIMATLNDNNIDRSSFEKLVTNRNIYREQLAGLRSGYNAAAQQGLSGTIGLSNFYGAYR